MNEHPLTWEQYLDALPAERRNAIEQVWECIRSHMPLGYIETIGPKFLSFSTEGESYVALANQKNYISLYLVPAYVYPELKAQLDGSGKKLKMGKSCINFKQAEELPLDTIGDIIAATPAEAYIAHIRAVRQQHRKTAK